MMLAMAFEAILFSDLRCGVVTFILANAGIDLFVALQTLGIGHFVAQLVAFGAVEYTLQFSVRSSEWPRGDLCETSQR